MAYFETILVIIELIDLEEKQKRIIQQAVSNFQVGAKSHRHPLLNEIDVVNSYFSLLSI